MNSTYLADERYEHLLDALELAATYPCPTGALTSRDALMIALGDAAGIFPMSIRDHEPDPAVVAIFGKMVPAALQDAA